MFPVNFNPSLRYCIIVPSYDPLMEYYTNGAGAPSLGHTRYCPERGDSRLSAGAFSAAPSRTDQHFSSDRAEADGGGTTDCPATCQLPRLGDNDAVSVAEELYGPSRSGLGSRTVRRWTSCRIASSTLMEGSIPEAFEPR